MKTKRPWKWWLRKCHRWLGLCIGIQFLMWTVGGLYFSWSNMDEIHGVDLVNAPVNLSGDIEVVYPQTGIDVLRQEKGLTELLKVELFSLNGVPLFRIRYKGEEGGVALADAVTGKLRPPLSLDEARMLAVSRYAGTGNLVEEVLLIEVSSHSEYRELPLPAYRFGFDDDRNFKIYVGIEVGRITSYRNSRWRIFDFLWMLHTMDYEERDNIGNWLLRAFSIFGLLTISSGFALFFATVRMKKTG